MLPCIVHLIKHDIGQRGPSHPCIKGSQGNWVYRVIIGTSVGSDLVQDVADQCCPSRLMTEINQPTNYSTNQQINQPTNQQMNRLTARPPARPPARPTNEPTNEPLKENTNASDKSGLHNLQNTFYRLSTNYVQMSPCWFCCFACCRTEPDIMRTSVSTLSHTS